MVALPGVPQPPSPSPNLAPRTQPVLRQMRPLPCPAGLPDPARRRFSATNPVFVAENRLHAGQGAGSLPLLVAKPAACWARCRLCAIDLPFLAENRLHAQHGAGFAPGAPAAATHAEPQPPHRTGSAPGTPAATTRRASLPYIPREIIAPTNKRRCASVRHALLAVFPKSAGPESSDAVQAT